MKRTVEAIYDGEVLRPQGPLDAEPNRRYRVTVEDVDPVDVAMDEERPLLRILALARELDLPPDYAAQLHHYLHGHPKQ